MGTAKEKIEQKGACRRKYDGKGALKCLDKWFSIRVP